MKEMERQKKMEKKITKRYKEIEEQKLKKQKEMEKTETEATNVKKLYS